MMRFMGIGKVLCVLLADFSVLLALFPSPLPAILFTAAAALYAWQGGRLGLWQERAVLSSRLPRMERQRLEESVFISSNPLFLHSLQLCLQW